MTTKHFRFSEVAAAPDTPGVYAWYYRIELTDKDIARCVESIDLADNQEARDGIMRDFLNNHLFRFYKEVPYFVSLSGKLKPRYEGMIDQRSDISESLIRRLATSPNNLYELKSTLRSAVPLFASPVYIGVATRLRERLLQHVRLIDYYQHINGVVAGLLADDFQGTSTKGARFTKADELKDEKGPRTAHDCRLDEAKVRFFGDRLAVAYGSEHYVGKDKSQPNAKVCRVWTDTWLKRGGTWRIIASHDNRVECR